MPPTLTLIHTLLWFLLTASFSHAIALPQWNDAITDAGKVGIPAEMSCYTGGYVPNIEDVKKVIKNVCGPVSKNKFGPGGQPEIRALQQNSVWGLKEPMILAKVVWHDNPVCAAQGKNRLSKKQCNYVFNLIMNAKGDPEGCSYPGLGGVAEDLCFLYVLDPNPTVCCSPSPHCRV